MNAAAMMVSQAMASVAKLSACLNVMTESAVMTPAAMFAANANQTNDVPMMASVKTSACLNVMTESAVMTAAAMFAANVNAGGLAMMMADVKTPSIGADSNGPSKSMSVQVIFSQSMVEYTSKASPTGRPPPMRTNRCLLKWAMVPMEVSQMEQIGTGAMPKPTGSMMAMMPGSRITMSTWVKSQSRERDDLTSLCASVPMEDNHGPSVT